MVSALVCITPPLFANPASHFNFQHLTVADGLIQGSVQAIVQDRHGFMWFGTQQGLSRYDGVEFKTYRHDPTDSDSLPGDWIWDLHVDQQGNLWVGTLHNGLALYDEAIDGFRSIEGNLDVRSIAEDPSGLLWLSINEDGVATYHPQTQSLQTEHEVVGESFRSKAIFTDAYSNVWVGTDQGLLRRDPVSQEYTPVPGIPADVIVEVLQGDERSIWVGTEDQGVFYIDISTLETQQLSTDNAASPGLNSNRVRAMLIDQAGTLWLGHDTNGVNYRHPAGELDTIVAGPDNRRALLDDQVRALYEDRNGLLWVGTQNGITRLNRTNTSFVNFSPGPFPEASLTGNWVSNFAEKSPTEFWVATYGGGLNLINLKNHTVQSFRHQAGDLQRPAEDRIMTVEVTDDGELWAGTRSKGISVLQTDGLWRHYQHDPTDPTSLSSNTVADIYQDRSGTLWIATMGGGVNRYVPEQDMFVHYQTGLVGPNAMCSDKILNVLKDTGGVLWFATYDMGLCRLDPSTGEMTHFRHDPDNATSLSSDMAWLVTEDKFGNLLVGTERSGINIWLAADRAKQIEKFHRLSPSNGLTSNAVYGIESDSMGRIWIGSNLGLTRYTLNTENDQISLDKRHFTVDDGLVGNEFNYAASLRASNGKILFGGTEGLSIFQPETHPQQRPPPAIALTGFRKMNEPVRFNIDQPTFTVEYDDKLIQFNYAALDFEAPNRIRYQHQLEGFDEDWVDDGNLSQATYTNLAPGQYELKVRAIREGDVWPESGLRIPMTINAPVWATAQAYTAYALLFLMLSFLVYRSWTRRLMQASELREMNLALRAEVKARQQQESALQQAQQQARQYLEVAEVPIIALSEAGIVTMINKKGARLIGLAEEEIIGRNFASSFVPVDARSDFLAELTNISQYAYSESRLTSNDGTERLIAWHNVRLSSSDTPANGILMSGSDLTQMRKLESQLRDGQKMEALGTLARGVAHDFNNILSAILGYSELTRTKLENQLEAKDYLHKLEGSVNRAKEIVSSILTFGRAQQLPIKLIDLSSALNDALNLVRPIIPANVRLFESIDQLDGPVLANPAHVTQIILNLCTNACQAMTDGGGELRVRLVNHELSRDQARESGKLQPGPYAMIIVEDTGQGMDDYTRSRIFEPFFTTHAPGQGSGLGLSVVHGVVSQIGGSIEVTSEPQQGTRFEIVLPCLVDEPMPNLIEDLAAPYAPVSSSTRSGTILFVDDEQDVSTIAQLNLSELGFNVVTAENAEVALKILTQQTINLVVTDQTMPGMRGEELATVVKRLYPDMPIILISGADQPEIDAIDGFLNKPFSSTALVEKINTLLDVVT